MTHPTPDLLSSARERVTPLLRAASARLEPDVRRAVDYHWGFCDEHGEPCDARSGKALRPALALLAAEAVGADASRALSVAAAVEIVHDFTLVHDDVMDEDVERRGRPAVWTRFGVGGAICAGDALVLLAQSLLLRDESPHRVPALVELNGATQQVIAGQMLDLSFEGRLDVDVADYLDMAVKKTGALLGGAAASAAILCGASSDATKALRRFGQQLGLAFQAVDDWLGIWGDPERVGKPAASDLRQRKASLPIVLAMSSGGPGSEEIRRWMASNEPFDDEALLRAVRCLEAVGAERLTVARARRELDGALETAATAPIDPVARTKLVEIATFVVERVF